MIVWQISPPRMGSTWQFNVARELLGLNDKPTKSMYISNELELRHLHLDRHTNYLIKTHNLEPSMYELVAQQFDAKLLISYRNIFDTVRSWRRLNLSQSDLSTLVSINNVLDNISELLKFDLDCHLTYIDELKSINDHVYEISSISDFLELDANSRDLFTLATSLTQDRIQIRLGEDRGLAGRFEISDPITLWHGNHISPDFLVERLKVGFEFLPLSINSMNSDSKSATKRLIDQTQNLIDFISFYQSLSPHSSSERSRFVKFTEDSKLALRGIRRRFIF